MLNDRCLVTGYLVEGYGLQARNSAVYDEY